MLKGNIEYFIGVVQVFIGVVGLVKIDGEYVKGEFLVLFVIIEGMLVVLYNCGMKFFNMSGGIKLMVVDDVMQCVFVFVFFDVCGVWDFVKWVNENIGKICEEVEVIFLVVKFIYIDSFLLNKFVFLCFNY